MKRQRLLGRQGSLMNVETAQRSRRDKVRGRSARRIIVLCTLLSMLGARPALAGPAAMSKAEAILGAVTQPAVALSSTAASANTVTYTINFSTSASGAIPAGGTITLAAPPGTLWPSSQQLSSYVLTDSTTPSGSFGSAAGLRFAAPGLPIYNFLNASGADVSITVPNAINAGDALSLVVSGVANPGAGNGSVAVSTSADPTPVSSTNYTITAAGSVSQPSVALSSTAAGANAVTYAINFSTSASGAVPAGGTINLAAPPGTLWPSSQQVTSYVLTDSTTPSGSFGSAAGLHFAAPGLPIYNFLNSSGADVSITVPNPINAGDALSLVVSGVANPGAGNGSVAVSTSADPTPVSSTNYTITAAGSVSQPAVTLSSMVSGAGGVTYTIGFNAGATGAMPSGGTITITAPPGTLWPAILNDYALTDTATSSGSFSSAKSVQTAANGSTVTIGLPTAIQAGDTLSLSVVGVTNPGAGADTLTVSTASSPSPAISASYTLTGTPVSVSSVSSPSLLLSSTVGGANGVTYAVSFTTSAGAGQIVGGSGTITLAAPAGTIFGACPYGCGNGNATYTITDVTNSARSGTAVPVAVIGGGSVVDIAPTNTIQAGDQIVVTITQVTNPPAGASTIAVSTSSDAGPVSISDPISAPQSVSSPSLSLSSTAGGANGVTYVVGFTTSPGAGSILGGLGAITLVAAAGTIFGPCPYGCGGGNPTYTITDATHPSGSGSATPVSTVAGGSVVSIEPANTIQAGDSITMSITQVTNPPAGSGTVAVSTTSDPLPVTVADPIGLANPVGSPGLTLSNSAVGFNGVTYTVGFTTSTTGALQGGLSAITLAAPAGTIFSSTGPITITDATAPSGSGTVGGAAVIDGGAITSFVVPNPINAGDAVTVAVGGVTNASVGGLQSLSISTSSDTTPAALGFTLIQGTTVSGIVDASDTTPAVGAQVQACLASASCAVTVTDGSGAFTLDLPAGTYTFTAFAPAGSRDGSATGAFIVGSTGLSGITLKLGPPPGLHPGFTIISPSFGSEGSSTTNPSVYWGQPFTLQIDPSVFPTARTIVATQVVIHGIDLTTGLPATKIVNIGGTVGANPTGIVVGADPISVTVPALAPIHGNVTFTVNYASYPAGTTPPGVAAPEILDLVYPNAPPQTQPTDPVPGYFTNTGNSGGITLGGASIIGPDAQYFSIPPLSTLGVPPGPDCGTGPVPLQQYIGIGQPSTADTCGAGVLFSPPDGGTRIFYYATLEVSAGAKGEVPVSLIGCDDRIGMDASMVTGFDPCASGGPDDDAGGDEEEPPPPPPPPPPPGPINGNTSGGGGYVDPSGTVLVTDGHTIAAPLSGATVTLEQGPTLAGPFSAVPNGSAIMSPANRVNPGTTDTQGQFGWDVLAGSYEVTATSPGCTPAGTAALAIPPPVTGLSLTITCPTMPTRDATQSALATSAADSPYGNPVTLTALVTGTGSPNGIVTFSDGATTIGAGVLNNGTATLTVNTLAPGPHFMSAAYAGDAGNQPSTALSITQTISVAPAITTQPTSQTVSAGQSATFTAAASGNPAPSVQWQISIDGGGSFSDLTGATSATLSFSTTAGQNGYEYRAVFTNGADTATSNAVTLTVGNPPPVIIPPTSPPSGAGATPIPPTAQATATSVPTTTTPPSAVPTTTATPTVAATTRPIAPSVGNTTWYFVGGRTDAGYTDILNLLNTADQTVHGTIAVYHGAGQSTVKSFTVGPRMRDNLDVKAFTGVSGRVAIEIQTQLPVVVSNTTEHGSLDLTASAGVSAPSRTWYLAEGYTGLTFVEELDLLNPGALPARVHLTWPQFAGKPATAHDLTLAPHSSQTVNVNTYVKHASHATIVTADQPIIAGRTMRFGPHDGGADSTEGVAHADTTLYFAEGSTADGFEEFLAILNPDSTKQAKVTAQFFGADGGLLGAKTLTIDPNHRANLTVNGVVRSAIVSTVLQSNIPVVAERSMYFGAPKSMNGGGTVGFGLPSPAQGWAFAGGDTHPGQAEFDLLLNPNQATCTVEADYYLYSGRIVRRTFTLAGHGRLNIEVGNMVPKVGQGYHGVVFRTVNGVPFVAEQALYGNHMTTGRAIQGVPFTIGN